MLAEPASIPRCDIPPHPVRCREIMTVDVPDLCGRFVLLYRSIFKKNETLR